MNRLVSLRPVKKYAKNLREILWPTTTPELHFRDRAMYPVNSRSFNRNNLEIQVLETGIHELNR